MQPEGFRKFYHEMLLEAVKLLHSNTGYWPHCLEIKIFNLFINDPCEYQIKIIVLLAHISMEL